MRRDGAGWGSDSGPVSSREESVTEERAGTLTVRVVLRGRRGPVATAGGFAVVCE